MQHLILLHGALGSKAQMQPLAHALETHYQVHTFNFSGHGGQAFPAGAFSIDLFSQELLTFMQQHQLSQAHVFGYSMGGYVAMYLAKQHPHLITKLITLATKYHWDEPTAAKEVAMLNASNIQQKLPAFAAQLQQRHAPNDWTELIDKIKQLLTSLGKKNALQQADYAAIHTPCMLLLGDRDKMVTLDETVTVYKQLPKAQLGILPNTPHPFEQVRIGWLAKLIGDFIG
jgi:pimeloyl-ACP methyl ester carboxylesterase